MLNDGTRILVPSDQLVAARIAMAAQRDLRLLKDYVFEMHRAVIEREAAAENDLWVRVNG